jgi:hypothetical protein
MGMEHSNCAGQCNQILLKGIVTMSANAFMCKWEEFVIN